ncbi:hypothetical protein NQT69_17620 [Pseudoalteromonas shioyasakiensis]|uniref:hypothetical protein n=1 Tax=Pseudoalteromonas shioyasakiensis TaxID=1190813 RepID=UPI0021198EDB|nr:hypothetical protein [Pseudoalteromonas shioyasakiensis]MCQ8879819.1 hypothetical protein [Pseudoalteromonas shioyasakiensis]
MKYAVIAGALTLFSITAAANQASSLSYDYVEVGYAKTDIKSNDKTDPDSSRYSGYDGYVINLSKQLSENWYVTGSYSQSRVDYSSTTAFTSFAPLPDGTSPSNMTDSYHETTDI